MALSVTVIDPPGITAWQLSTSTATDVMTALATWAELGYQGAASASTQVAGGDVTWVISLSRPGYADLIGYNGNWIVFDGTNFTILSDDAFLATYTMNTALVWAPTTTEPTATALPGLQATLVFDQPTSVNGPWTYTVAQDTGDTGGAAVLVGDPHVTAGQVTLTVGNLTDGAQYTFTVTVTTRYEGVTATSVASNQITAITSEP